jgi:hypothetical protein
MKNPLFGFGKKPAAKSGFEIAEEVFQSHNGQVDFDTFWKEFSPSQPGMRISEGRSIHADLSKQNWRFMKNGSGKKCNYRVIGKDERVLYDGQDFNKASDLMMKAQAPVRMLRDGVDISKRRPAGDVRRNGMTATRHMPDGSQRDTYSVNCGNKSYHTEDLADAKKKFNSWCRTGDCTLHHGRKLLDSNFEQKSPGMALFPRGLRNNPRDLTAAHKKILKAYIEGGGVACDYESLPSTVRKKLESTGYHETLESDCDRFLWDNNNPHMKRSKLWGNPRKIDKEVLSKYKYNVVVGNEDGVEAQYGRDERVAIEDYFKYHVKESKNPRSRFFKTTVTMFANGTEWKRYSPKEQSMERNPRKDYEVVVGNIGTVYSGNSLREASQCYSEYVKQSKMSSGHASGEDVTMFCAGEECKSYNAPDRSMERNPKSKESYSVVVGNIGQVHSGSNRAEAIKEYDDYVKASKSNKGRAGGEDVTLFCGREIERSHTGSVSLVGNGKKKLK